MHKQQNTKSNIDEGTRAVVNAPGYYHASSKLHPVYVLGLTLAQLTQVRTSYFSAYGKTSVGFYDMLDYDKLSERIGIEPSVVILAEHVSTVGSVGEFLKRYRTPVLRVMENPVPAASLAPEFYYNGVYDTLSEQDLYVAERLHFYINLGIMIWEKNKEQQSFLLANKTYDVIASNDPRGSKFRRSTLNVPVPEPESNWSEFLSKYLSHTRRLLETTPSTKAYLSESRQARFKHSFI